MRGIHSLACLGVVVGLNSGCALSNLKEANQRLKQSNDRLVAENNRLEHELAGLQPDLPVGGMPEATAVTVSAETERYQDPGSDIFPGMGPDQPVVTRSPIGTHFRFDDRVFFALGQAKLSRRGRAALDRMARVLNEQYPGNMIRVEGHTDDIPVRKVRHQYPSNWELSTARACTVVRYLIESAGVSPQQVYPTGFAYYRPLQSGKSSSARGQNRRVEITVLNQQI